MKQFETLKVGDLVKTYKNGYKKINIMKSFNYKCLDKSNQLCNLYKMKA